MWGRGRIDHFGLHAATPEAFDTIRQRLIATGASDGAVNDFGAASTACSSVIPTGSKARFWSPRLDFGSHTVAATP